MNEDNMAYWIVDNDAIYSLRKLNKLLMKYVDLADCGQHLIAIGEVVEAIDCIIEEVEYEFLNLGLSVGFRKNYEGISEGIFYDLRINDDEFYLEKLNIQNLGQGTDHRTDTFFCAKHNQPFNAENINKWINGVEEMLNLEEDIKLTVSRDHI